MKPKDYELLDNLTDAAAKFRDAFTYDPGHSDLDDEQPITITVTLGDWRRLNMLLPSKELHTDHPLRHFDRTCPACLAAGKEQR